MFSRLVALGPKVWVALEVVLLHWSLPLVAEPSQALLWAERWELQSPHRRNLKLWQSLVTLDDPQSSKEFR